MHYIKVAIFLHMKKLLKPKCPGLAGIPMHCHMVLQDVTCAWPAGLTRHMVTWRTMLTMLHHSAWRRFHLWTPELCGRLWLLAPLRRLNTWQNCWLIVWPRLFI